jgi:hypothetical protein
MPILMAAIIFGLSMDPLRRLYARYGMKEEEGFPGPRPDVALTYGRSGQ